MSYTLITAYDKNLLIGANNDLPWHLPKDLQLFKKNTIGKKILMGRKTCEIFPRPLPNRENYVLSNSGFKRDGFICINDTTQFDNSNEEIMIIGGAGIYNLFLPKANQMLITEIDGHFEGDTYFPAWDKKQWLISESIHYPISEKNKHSFNLVRYIKK